jgi:PAS domain S-box-containing protein
MPASTDCRRLAILIVGLIVCLCPAASADAPQRPSVLMLFSMTAMSPAVAGPQRAFQRELIEKMGGAVVFHPEYLDLLSGSDDAYGQSLATFLAEKYRTRPVGVVLVQRIEALTFLLRHRDRLLPGVPIVFTEINSSELGALTLPPDVTGAVTEGIVQTAQIAVGLRPGTRKLVLVVGGSLIERGQADWQTNYLRTLYPTLEVERLDGLPIETQEMRLAAEPPNTVVFFTSYRSDAAGHATVATEVLDRLARASGAPIFGVVEPHLGSGIVGGELIRLELLAERAADLAAQILKGTSAASLPFDRRPATVIAFDARQLKRWGISEGSLPPGSTVLFRERTLWTEYKWQALSGLALLIGQGLLIGGLVVQRRQRQRAQASLADAEHRYRTVADFGADWEYWTLPDGSLRYVSPSCETLTGYTVAEFLERPSLMSEIIAGEDLAAWQQHRAEGHAGAGRRTMEFRIRTRDGQTRWIEHVCARVTGPDGSDMGTRGSNRDVTPRKHAEEERTQAEARLRAALLEIQGLRDRLEIDNSYMREQLQPADDIEGILGASDAMRYVASRVQQVAPTASTVLLLGETGVGKSLLAQAIHDLSPRRARPLITLDCAALPPALVESELFGHEKGAFTGAQAMRMGRFEIAHGGTLFLDEVAELPLDLQGKLLRAVQSGEFERVGSNVTRKTDVRLIAATNRKLDEDVRVGRFRQDLLYRLNVFPITVPPLRQRREDIPLLVAHFLRKHGRRFGVPPPQVSRATIKALQAQEWPGNIRELENVVERALIATKGTRFDLVNETGLAGAGPALPGRPEDMRTLEQHERDYIVATLERLQWRIAGAGGAADALGINASTLRSRMRKHGIRRPAGRSTPSDAS